MLDGEKAIFQILFKMISTKKDVILKMREQDLLNYMRNGIVRDCIMEMSVSELLYQ